MPISWLASIDDLNDRRPSGTSRGPEREENLDLPFRIVSKYSSCAAKFELGIVSKGSITNIEYFDLSWTLETQQKAQ